VMLANVRRLNDDQLRALEEFVKGGGGLLAFPGSKLEASWYQSSLLREGKGLLPLAFARLSGEAREGAPSVGIVSQRFENPALELFNDPRNGSMADAAIRMWFKMAESADASMAADAPTVLARLENGDPFLVEKKFGEGHVIACATALDADWSNLPMRPFYLPLLQRLTVHLASTIFPPRNITVGKPIAAFAIVTDIDKEATVTAPNGEVSKAKVAKRGNRGLVEFSKTQRTVLYTLQLPSGSPIHYVVNADRRESDLAKLEPKEIADLAKAHDVALVRSAAEYMQLEQKRRFGTELWKSLLWTMFVFMAAEMVLEQLFAGVRRRKQPATIVGIPQVGRSA